MPHGLYIPKYRSALVRALVPESDWGRFPERFTWRPPMKGAPFRIEREEMLTLDDGVQVIAYQQAFNGSVVESHRRRTIVPGIVAGEYVRMDVPVRTGGIPTRIIHCSTHQDKVQAALDSAGFDGRTIYLMASEHPLDPNFIPLGARRR